MPCTKYISMLNPVLCGLWALRMFLILLPQVGYLHPDEYFQSVEVLAGKIFNVEYSPPWEFNTTFPIRGMTVPYFTTGMCFMFLRNIDNLAMEYLSLNVVTPYFLLVTPRFLIGLLSFVVDYCLYKICWHNNEKFQTRLIIFSTSYVTLVFGTRTFSNSIEIVFFALLLYFICETQTFSNELSRKKEYLNYRYNKSTSLVEKAKFHKLRLYLVSDTYRNCLIIASITVFGFFNRATFLAFAVLPVFFWIHRGTGARRVSVTHFHTRILFFALCCVPAFIFNVIIDSFYYGYLTWGEIGMLDISFNNFVVTPLNFIRYNMQAKNLAKHGIHPRYLHFLMNIPLLFNILGILALYTVGKYVYWIFRRKFNLLPSIKSIKMVMTMSFLSPVLLLSVFPHQEPRFIIPIILPLVYLHGQKILPEQDKILVKVPGAAIDGTNKPVALKTSNNVFWTFWLIFNSLFVIFFGFLHQGGIYAATNFLHKELELTPLNTEYHIITSNIYSFPESFLLQKNSNNLYSNRNVKYSVKKRVFLYEEGSKDLVNVIEKLRRMVDVKKMLTKNVIDTDKYKIYLLVSSSRNKQTQQVLQERNVLFKKLDSFSLHISTEAFPNFAEFCTSYTSIFYQNCEVLTFWNYLKRILDLCRITLYELEYTTYM